MIPRDLKPGDRFVDGGNTYVVLEVLPDGSYTSRIAGPEPLETPKKGRKTTSK